MDTPQALKAWMALVLLVLLPACSQPPAVGLYLPPTPAVNATPPSPPTASLPAPTAALECSNDLTGLSDLTLPDGTLVAAGSTLDKQWLVQNSGSCDWDAAYRLRFVSGDVMGAASDQPLYPARAGHQAVIRIVFTAPTDPGNYLSVWQAVGPDGTPFGEVIYIKVTVQGP
jgi:hypothetical protein